MVGSANFARWLIELTNCTVVLLAAMIEAGAVKPITEMLESQNDDVRYSASYALNRMANNGAVSLPCLIIQLIKSKQQTFGLL
jgi:hypothetical protein